MGEGNKMAKDSLESPAMVWNRSVQPLSLTLFKSSGVIVASFLLILLLRNVITALLANGDGWWLAIPALLVGYLGADLLSGTVHWFCDTFFDETTPVLGPIVIKPFREHHTFPQKILKYRFIDQDTTNFFLMIPLLAWALSSGAPHPGHGLQLASCCALLGLSIGSFFTNLFHKWAHCSQPPWGVRTLQRSGLILSPRRHAHHHRDHSRGFCVTSGWMNPTLDAVSFFPTLERVIRKLLP